MNACILIRCVEIGDSEKYLHSVLSKVFDPSDIFYVVDSICSSVRFDSKNVLHIDEEFLSSSSLFFGFPRPGWRCGDYVLYKAFKSLPQYDFYWVVEPDVFFPDGVVSSFFNEYECDDADFLAVGYGKKGPAWPWSHHLSVSYGEDLQPFGCVFALIRASRRAVECLFENRKKLSEVFSSGELDPIMYPNDESYCCSILNQSGYSCASFSSRYISKEYFSAIRPVLRKNIVGDFIVHPAVNDMAQVTKKARNKFRKELVNFKECFHGFVRANQYDREVTKELAELVSELLISDFSG